VKPGDLVEIISCDRNSSFEKMFIGHCIGKPGVLLEETIRHGKEYFYVLIGECNRLIPVENIRLNTE
jgi:hypothetical protein